MRKPLWILALVGAIGVYVLVVSIGGTPAARQGDAHEPSSALRPLSQTAPQPSSPKAVVEALEHDFGVCDPMAKGSHTFIIRNQGGGPLELEKGPSSCKCTLADFPVSVVPPGEAGQVQVSWTATTKHLLFDQQAVVLTNDPEHSSLVFRIKGEVRAHLLAEPPEIVFSSLAPGEVQTRSLTLFSQAWDEFEVTKVQVSNPQFKWAVKPAPREALAEVKGRSGYLLEVTSPTVPSSAEQPTGHFQETLKIRVAPKGHPEDELTYEVMVGGNRVTWSSVSGEGVDPHFGLKLGSIPLGQGIKRRVALLVRDANRKLKVARVEARPGFLKATVTPARTDGPWCNVYYLHVEIAADAPRCTHLSGDEGEVRIYSDDPKLPAVTMPVAFAVVRGGSK